ncbi:hypothetical protein SH528x_007292 [Novipirellula sp. SH528]|uniref:hypothetical protein n=1 Tax=Novipirellula sp. SH528 TaxID=3454466 RepID=UPI003F9F131B
MTKRTNRGRLPNPDRRGYVRPEVGDKRFSVGNIRDVGTSEMERRLADLRNLFERQCQYHEIDHWAGSVLSHAKKLAAGERLVLRVSDFARNNEGQASEEAQRLHELRELGLDIVADDPSALARGERELKELVDATVRDTLAEAMATVDTRFESFPSDLIGVLRTTVPSDPSKIETRTFFDAIDGYRQYRKKTGKRKDNGLPSPSVQNYLDIAKRFKKNMTNFPIWELTDKNKIDELFAIWRTRPVSNHTGTPISADHAKHTMDCLWSILVWIDEEGDWRWELPKGSSRIKRTADSLHSDRKKNQTRRVSGNTYTPEQLAVIAEHLDQFGKMILGLSVNCAMQAAEVGRLEVNDIFDRHPSTNATGKWVILNRPKTGEYGEWLLWPEVAFLARWGQERSRRIGCDRLIVSENGVPWYREDWKNPQQYFSQWWQAKPTKASRRIGVVTRICRERDDFPRHSFKSIRKILPNLVRPKFGREIADLINARRIDGSGRVSGKDTDRYSDRPYERVAEALTDLRDHFQPFLDALRCEPE